MSEELVALDIDCVTITRDQNGEIVVDGGGLSLESLIFLLHAAEHIIMYDFFASEDDDEEDE